ncbi:MAG TPA: hypothetical protein VIU11_00295 [Nakamurella sp.]
MLIPPVIVAISAADPGVMRLVLVIVMTALTLWSGLMCAGQPEFMSNG